MEIKVMRLAQMKPEEMFEYFQLRSQIFVLEQQCVYLDMDDKDKTALHVLGLVQGRVVAGSRILDDPQNGEMKIGRVVVAASHRGLGLGRKLMEASIDAVKQVPFTGIIRIEAQMYLQSFYKGLGFENDGPEFLEDGLPHIEMVRTV